MADYEMKDLMKDIQNLSEKINEFDGGKPAPAPCGPAPVRPPYHEKCDLCDERGKILKSIAEVEEDLGDFIDDLGDTLENASDHQCPHSIKDLTKLVEATYFPLLAIAYIYTQTVIKLEVACKCPFDDKRC